jgi:copper(I)-binding protein
MKSNNPKVKTALLGTVLAMSILGFVSVPSYADGHEHHGMNNKMDLTAEAISEMTTEQADVNEEMIVKPAIELMDLIIKEPAPGAKALAGMLTIVNNTDSDNAVISATSDVSEIVELHTMTMNDDIMRMRKVEKIAVPANGKAVLSMETGDHLMYINPTGDVKAGDVVKTILTFENGARMEADMVVMGRDGVSDDVSHDHHDHSNHMIQDGAIDESAVDVEVIEGEHKYEGDKGHDHHHGHGH